MRTAALALVALGAGPAAAADAPKLWMLGLSGGSFGRDGDETRAYGSAALTRKIGRGYVRAGVTRFGSAVRQVDVDLPSTYTLGFLSAGASFGRWFVDGYATLGDQRYRPVRTPIGSRPLAGTTRSGVLGAGGDAGYVAWLGTRWSLTPSLSLQAIRSRALREQVGPTGPSEYETRETGVTAGGTLRLDHLFGRDRANSVGVRVTRTLTSNASAALTSGTRGAFGAGAQSSKQSDGWTEFGGNVTLRLRPDLYLDAGLSQTVGASAGDLTTTVAGFRFLF